MIFSSIVEITIVHNVVDLFAKSGQVTRTDHLTWLPKGLKLCHATIYSDFFETFKMVEHSTCQSRRVGERRMGLPYAFPVTYVLTRSL